MLSKKFLLQIIGVLFVFILLGSCQNAGSFSEGSKRLLVKTKTAKAVLAVFYEKSIGYGSIQAINSLDLEAKFDGIVHFESLKGRIKKGGMLYRLGGLEIAMQKENLKKILSQAQTEYDYYKQVYHAQKLLNENKFVSKIDFEKIASDFEKAQNNLNKAQYDLNYFSIMTFYKAPFDGYLDNILVAQGEDAAAGQLLATFQEDDHLKLIAVYYGALKALGADSLSLRINGLNYKGRLIYKEQAINPVTGGRTLWIALNDPDHHLKSGSQVSYSFVFDKHKSVAVPEAALIRQQSAFFVVALQNGKYYKTAVVRGAEKNGLVEIKSGLKQGTKVLTQGAFEIFYGNLRDKMKIED